MFAGEATDGGYVGGAPLGAEESAGAEAGGDAGTAGFSVDNIVV